MSASPEALGRTLARMLNKQVRRTDVPAIPQLPPDVDPGIRRAFDALREVVEVRDQGRGEFLDGNVTRRELVESGLATLGGTGGDGGTGGPVLEPPSDTPVDTTPPLALTGLTAWGTFEAIYLAWDQPRHRSHAFTKIYRAPFRVPDGHGGERPPLFADAVLVGTSAANVFADLVGKDQRHYYWITSVSTADIEGPINSVAGTLGMTAVGVDYIREVIAGRLRETDLDDLLREKINDPSRSVQDLIWGQDLSGRFQGLESRYDRLAEQVIRGLDLDLTGRGKVGQQVRDTRQNLSELSVQHDQLRAGVRNLEQATVFGDAALSSRLVELTADSEAGRAMVRTLEEAYATKDVLRAVRIEDVRAGAAAVQVVSLALQDATQALSQRITDVSAAHATTSARVTTFEQAYATDKQATATRLTAVEAKAASNQSNISSLQNTVVTQYSALASSLDTVNTTVNGHSTTIQQHTTSIDGLKGRWSLKIQSMGSGPSARPVVAGLTLGLENNYSRFIVMANDFYIIPPDGESPETSFFSVITEGGKQVAYMDTAFIRDASIQSAKIANLAADKITAGTINVALQLNAAYIYGGSIQIGSFFNVQSNGVMTARGAIINDALISNARITSLTADTVDIVDTLQIRDNAVTFAEHVSGGNTATIVITVQPGMRRLVIGATWVCGSGAASFIARLTAQAFVGVSPYGVTMLFNTHLWNESSPASFHVFDVPSNATHVHVTVSGRKVADSTQLEPAVGYVAAGVWGGRR